MLRSAPVPLSIIIADVSGGERLLASLRALRDARMALPCEVIAVVGGPDLGLLPALRQEFPLVSLYQAWGDADLGSLYGIACRAAAGKLILLMDGSVRVGAGAIADMTAFMAQGPWVAMVAPRLQTLEGRDVAPTRLFPTVGTTFAEFEGRAADAAGPRIQHALDRRVTTPKEVDAVVSGCCMIKREALDQVGPFAEGYPGRGAMLDWCRRARHGGWSIFYHPGHAVDLLADESDNPHRAAVRLAAACRFIRRHRGLPDVLMLGVLLILPISRGLVTGSAALIPGTHREAARGRFLRAWYGLGALVAPRRLASQL